MEEIKFAECSSSFDGNTKCRKDRITNFVDRLPSLVQVILPPRVFEMFKKYDAIEKLEKAFVKIDCSCENLDGVENLKYALNVLNPVNPCRKRQNQENENLKITSDNRQITQALNFIFNFTNRQIGKTPDTQKTMEMITLLIKVTKQKNYELNCLKEFFTKFHGFYKKTQLASLEKDCDPMQAFSSGMTGPRRARPVMPFYQNFNSILQTCRKKEAIFTGLEDYFQLLQAVTAVFYNCLSDRIEISKSVSKSLVPKILHSVLDILELTSISTEFMRAAKNCLLILCQESALSSEFDFFRASSLILKTLDRFGWDKDVNKHDQLNIRRLTVAITSILASKVGTDQTPLLGSRQYLSRIIMCAKERFLDSTRANMIAVQLASSPAEFQHATSIDAIYKYSLSALWNLTDESPNSCAIFIEEGGLEVCLESLDLYEDDEIKDHYTNKVEVDESMKDMSPAELLEAEKNETRVKQRVQLYRRLEKQLEFGKFYLIYTFLRFFAILCDFVRFFAFFCVFTHFFNLFPRQSSRTLEQRRRSPDFTPELQSKSTRTNPTKTVPRRRQNRAYNGRRILRGWYSVSHAHERNLRPRCFSATLFSCFPRPKFRPTRL